MVTAIEARQNSRLTLAVDVLRSGNRIRLKAQGTSMLPTIWPGDVLSIESKRAADICVGDIVLVLAEDGFRVHRLTLIADGNSYPLSTRGDSMTHADPVSGAELLGKVTLIERKGRTITPERRRSPMNRIVGALLGRSAVAVNIALRLRRALVREVQPDPLSAQEDCA